MIPKYKIGQVWRNTRSFPNTVFIVCRIEDGEVWARRNGGEASRFAYVSSTIDKGWEDITADYNRNDWMAWRHSAPGDCVCGIPRSLCDYHR